MVTTVELRGLVEERLRHPTIKFFYDEFQRLEIDVHYVELFKELPQQLHSPLLHIYETHVTKEKALLTYGFCMYATGSESKSRFLAFAVDLLWLMSLVYDDIVDKDECRSGLQSAWATFGESKCQSALESAYSILLSMIAEKLSFSMSELCKKQVKKSLASLEVHRGFSLSNTLEDVVTNYMDRSAFHDEFAVRAAFEGVGTQGFASLLEAMFMLNLAGQVLNDLKDFEGRKWYGRRAFTDVRAGFVTYPILWLYQTMGTDDKYLFSRIFGVDKPQTEKQTWILVNKYSMLVDVGKFVLSYYRIYLDNVKILFGDKTYFSYFQTWYDYKVAQVRKICGNNTGGIN